MGYRYERIAQRFVATGDFDEDGRQDLVVMSHGYPQVNPVLSVWLGDGESAFSPASTYEVGEWPKSVAVADLDRDGHQDLAVANFSSVSVSILFGEGAGSFSPAIHYGVGGGPLSVAVGDFDGSGYDDMVVLNYFSDDIDPDVNPGVEEICDNDCDGYTDRADQGCAEPCLAQIGPFMDRSDRVLPDPGPDLPFNRQAITGKIVLKTYRQNSY